MMTLRLTQTGNTHPDFIDLTRELDQELNRRYKKAQADYDQYNQIDPIPTALVGYVDRIPVACGCFKPIETGTIEIKRMYVKKEYQRNGFAMTLLQALEKWGSRLGYAFARLETGKGQPEARKLYEKAGYGIIENYGPYKTMDNSICMEKRIFNQNE